MLLSWMIRQWNCSVKSFAAVLWTVYIIGLDYFDASINRIGAYVIGSRAAQKCMTRALLEPIAKLREYEANGQGFQRLALLEEEKALPWNAVWDMFCLKNNVPVGEDSSQNRKVRSRSNF